MAFSFLEKILSVIPSILAPGPVGNIATAGLTTFFGGGPRPTGATGTSIVSLGGAVGPQFLGAKMPGLVGGAVGLGVSLLSEILFRAKESTGRRVTKREIIQAAKVCGIELAAQSFGLSEIDICRVIAAGAPRRRRGISAADMRRTRSTIRKVNTIRKDLKQLAR